MDVCVAGPMDAHNIQSYQSLTWTCKLLLWVSKWQMASRWNWLPAQPLPLPHPFLLQSCKATWRPPSPILLLAWAHLPTSTVQSSSPRQKCQSFNLMGNASSKDGGNLMAPTSGDSHSKPTSQACQRWRCLPIMRNWAHAEALPFFCGSTPWVPIRWSAPFHLPQSPLLSPTLLLPQLVWTSYIPLMDSTPIMKARPAWSPIPIEGLKPWHLWPRLPRPSLIPKALILQAWWRSLVSITPA